jgi:hypothetical protein
VPVENPRAIFSRDDAKAQREMPLIHEFTQRNIALRSRSQIQKTLLEFGVQTFSLTFSLLVPIGAVFTKEKRLQETKSQTESLDSEPRKPLSKNKKSCNGSTKACFHFALRKPHPAFQRRPKRPICFFDSFWISFNIHRSAFSVRRWFLAKAPRRKKDILATLRFCVR